MSLVRTRMWHARSRFRWKGQGEGRPLTQAIGLQSLLPEAELTLCLRFPSKDEVR